MAEGGKVGRKAGWNVRRWLAPVVGAVLLLSGGIGWWAAPTDGATAVEAAPAAAVREAVQDSPAKAAAPVARDSPAPVAPEAASAFLPGGEIPETARRPARSSGRERVALTDAEREARRFNRADRDKNGVVSREEFLASRRKVFEKLDRNRDGLLTFEEFAASAAARFDAADRNGDRLLSRREFAATASRRTADTARDDSGRDGGNVSGS